MSKNFNEEKHDFGHAYTLPGSKSGAVYYPYGKVRTFKDDPSRGAYIDALSVDANDNWVANGVLVTDIVRAPEFDLILKSDAQSVLESVHNALDVNGTRSDHKKFIEEKLESLEAA